MAIKLIALVITLCVASWDVAQGRSLRFSTTPLNRYSFPPHFDFGVASSAYQYEGAVEEGGRSLSIWDNFTHAFPERTNMDNGDVAVDFYHRYKAMGRCSKWVNSLCIAGDSGTEPYLVSHHLLLAHAAAVEEFRKCDKISQDSKIGIVLSPYWFEPYDSASNADKEAVERALAFNIGWHLSPLVFGDYPETIKISAGNRLPSFTKEQSMMVKNSFDFIGVNYYTARFVAHDLNVDISRPRFMTDQHLQYKLTNRTGDTISLESDGTKILWSYPEGLRKILNYIKNKYNNPTIYITENGFDDYENGTVTREEILEDTKRIEYHQKHLQELQKAITEDGCDVKGYFTWSLLDNFEWEHGYAVRFGLYYVDYKNGLQRHAKHSAMWFKHFLERSGKPMPMDLFKSVKRWWSTLQMI
ncbi:unnamed protein product [Arabidopsis thaliana]|uniref:(thale cress) hypothetical protein n=1 Tax=Arabidopsis thaliana TaxID=3702 RepID=A0A7G2FGY4_ARATH|nr:unnamed protein product [Arabidopsis thaliana]